MVITISREYGAAGRAVTHRLAEKLGFRLLDEDLPVVVAARMGTSPDVVEGLEYRPAGFGQRLLQSFSAAVPEAFQPSPEVDDLHDATQREVDRLMQSLGCAAAVARAEIARVDGGRRNYAREQGGFDWGDPHFYDLVIDVASFGVEGAVTLIDAARIART